MIIVIIRPLQTSCLADKYPLAVHNSRRVESRVISPNITKYKNLPYNEGGRNSSPSWKTRCRGISGEVAKFIFGSKLQEGRETFLLSSLSTSAFLRRAFSSFLIIPDLFAAILLHTTGCQTVCVNSSTLLLSWPFWWILRLFGVVNKERIRIFWILMGSC